MQRHRIPMLTSVLAALAGLPITLLADDVHCPPDLGSVTIDGNVLVAAACRLDGTTARIGGSIQLKSNRSRLEVLGNTVNADVQAFSNTGGMIVADNVIDGNLQCKSNDPPPAGGNNRVQGNKEDQCATLAPETGPAPSTGAVESPAQASSGGGSFDLPASLLMMALLFAQLATRSLRRVLRN